MPSIKNLFKSIALHLPATRGMVEEVKAELMIRDNELAAEIQQVRDEMKKSDEFNKKLVELKVNKATVDVKLELRDEFLSVEKEIREDLLSLQDRVLQLERELKELRSQSKRQSKRSKRLKTSTSEETKTDDGVALLSPAKEENEDDGAVAINTEAPSSADDIAEDPENPILGADEKFYEEFFDNGELSLSDEEPMEVKEINVIKKK